MFRAWRIQLFIVVTLFGLMLILLIINGILLLQAGYVWLAMGQSLAIVVLVGVSLFLYQRVWLEIQRHRVLRQISATLTDRGGLNEFLDSIVTASLQLFSLSDRCSIHLLDEAGEKLYLRSSSAPKLESLQPIPVSQGIINEILRDLTPRLIPDTRQVQGPLPIDPGLGRGSLVVVPLQAQGRPLGILSLYSHITGVFAQQDRLLLTVLANLASAALDRARLEGVSLGEAGLTDHLIAGLADGVVILDEEDRVLYYNASLAPLLGVDIGEVVGQRVHVESENVAARRLALLLACAPSDVEPRHEVPGALGRSVPLLFPGLCVSGS